MVAAAALASLAAAVGNAWLAAVDGSPGYAIAAVAFAVACGLWVAKGLADGWS